MTKWDVYCELKSDIVEIYYCNSSSNEFKKKDTSIFNCDLKLFGKIQHLPLKMFFKKKGMR